MFKIKFELNVYVNTDKCCDDNGAALVSKQIKRKEAPCGIMEYVKRKTAEFGEDHSYSTVQNYRTAARSLCAYAGHGTDVPLSQIDDNMIMGYQRWLQHRNICMNTVSCYLRSLRSVYKKAVDDGLTVDVSPFRHSFTGKETTIKRSLTEEDIRKIRFLHFRRGTRADLTRDLFMFSFCAQGMPFVDIAFLRLSQIKDDTLTYKRHKTGQQVTVNLLPCMMTIINKYARDDREYIFPIISASDEGTAYREYRDMLGKYNRVLKKIGRMAGVSCNLTSYSARHTWASIAFDKNVDLPVISKALGHTDTKTTMVYIKEINDRRLAEANEKILDSFGLF